MCIKGKFNNVKRELDIKLRENHKEHKAVYKFKGIDNNKESFERIIDIIKNNRIYAPTRSEVNDPFEGALIRTEYGYAGNWNHIARKEISKITSRELDKFRFLSLSSKANRPQLWAYYANNFSGVCLAYSTNKSFENYSNILYLNEEQRNRICTVINNPDKDEINLIAKYNLLLKADDWIKEDEVRIIIKEDEKYINFDDDELIGIIIGHNIEEKYINIIIEEAHRKNIQLYKTYLDQLKLNVDILPYEFDLTNIFIEGADYHEVLIDWLKESKNEYILGLDGQISKI